MSGAGFGYARAADLAQAARLGSTPGAAFLAGGTDLLQLWKAGVASLDQVIDISRLGLDAIEAEDGALTLGALARLSAVAAHPAVHPLIAQSILASASGQIRNMATIGGNLLQRTRCAYFRDPALPCNKRAPGSGCGALAGQNRNAVLFGASPACVATHPSDLAVALAALEARVTIQGPGGRRALDLEALYRLPGDTPERDTVLAPGELIVSVTVPALAGRSTYLKVRDRASFEFAVVSVAAVLRLEAGVIAQARLAAGGVAPRPWRLREAEAVLVGRPPGPQAFAAAAEAEAEAAIEGARPLAGNGFKLPLLRGAVVRALETVGETA